MRITALIRDLAGQGTTLADIKAAANVMAGWDPKYRVTASWVATTGKLSDVITRGRAGDTGPPDTSAARLKAVEERNEKVRCEREAKERGFDSVEAFRHWEAALARGEPWASAPTNRVLGVAGNGSRGP